MMIKFHKAGASGGDAADYLEGERDHKGRSRENVEVLRGDPFRVGQIADSLEFKHRLTAGVIAWAPGDSPNPEQIDEVLDNFERLAWAGLEPDRYAWSAVRHDEPSGGVHVHIMTARVDLQTGKSLNIAPPGWQYDFDPLRDALNIKHGWARPDDPARAGSVYLESHENKIKAEQKKSGLPAGKIDIETLTDHLTEQITLGFIENRNDVLLALKDIGEITRAGKNYISLKLPGDKKATRLRGAIYDEQFNGDTYRENKETAGRTGTRTPESRQADFNAAKDRHNAAVRRRGKFSRKKYGDGKDLAEKESDFQVVDIPAGNGGDSALNHTTRNVDHGEFNHGLYENQNRRAINRNTQERREPEDHEALGDSTESSQRHGSALPVVAQRFSKARTQKKRRRLSVRNARRLRRHKGEMSHDGTRRTAPGRSDQTGEWYERLVRATNGNKHSIEQFDRTHATSTKQFGEFFGATAGILRGATEIIDVAKQLARTLYEIVKKAMTPTYSGSEIEID